MGMYGAGVPGGPRRELPRRRAGYWPGRRALALLGVTHNRFDPSLAAVALLCFCWRALGPPLPPGPGGSPFRRPAGGRGGGAARALGRLERRPVRESLASGGGPTRRPRAPGPAGAGRPCGPPHRAPSLGVVQRLLGRRLHAPAQRPATGDARRRTAFVVSAIALLASGVRERGASPARPVDGRVRGREHSSRTLACLSPLVPNGGTVYTAATSWARRSVGGVVCTH